jgi:beta-glucosidase
MNTKKPKVRLWSVLTALTAILTIAAIVGNMIANQYATTLNVALNASTYKIIKGDTTEDTEYFKAGFTSDEEREAYEAELCATVEAEGAALLKNDNAALPLAGSAKVSLFGHGSVDLMYGGTGSGSVDTSKAPNLKEALEAQGIQVNQTLWDLYKSDSMMTNYSRVTPASISDTLEANTQYAVNEAPWSALSSAGSPVPRAAATIWSCLLKRSSC